jgi:hypothetical protein
MKVNEYLPNLDVEAPLMSKPPFDLNHSNVSIGPDKWPIFGRFLMLFPLKRLARHGKNTSQYGGRPSMTSSCDVTASPLLDTLKQNLYLWMDLNCFCKIINSNTMSMGFSILNFYFNQIYF